MRHLLVLVFTLMAAVASAQPRPIIIDHTSFPLYAQIPPDYLANAALLQFEFADRSVGVNVLEGFTQCLSRTYGEAPSSCRGIKAGLPAEPWTPVVAHPTFHGWPNLGLPNPMTCTQSNGFWTGLVPCWRSFIAPTVDNYDVVGVMPDYLLATGANSMEHFFEDLPGDYDAYDLLAYAKTIKAVMLWWTPGPNKGESSTGSLARLQGYAQLARQFATDNNLVLVDLYDIFTHKRDGTLCTNTAGYPIQCDEWGSERNGGHMSYGATKVRAAQMTLIALAQIVGWNPNGPPPPPADTEKPTQGSVCSTLVEPLLEGSCTFHFTDNTGVTHIRITQTVEDAAGNTTTDTYEYPQVPR